MSQKTIAILSVSAGAGHIRAAEALRVTAEKNYPDIKTVHIDIMDLVSPVYKKFYADSYIHIVEKYPTLWLYLYSHTDDPDNRSLITRLFMASERLNSGKLMKELDKIQPDHVICTHFLPPNVLSRMIQKNRFHRPVWVQVTDFDIHGLWIHGRMEGYFAGNDEVAYRMKERGIPKERIYVTGIPIMPVFNEKHDRIECARELGVDPDKFTILMLSGGGGVVGIDKLLGNLLNFPYDFQIIAIAGRNQKLFDKLQQIASNYPNRFYPMGYTTTIERVMATSDLAVTKPGGLSVSECLAVGLPMIIVSAIPGQEEKNLNYLLETGAALRSFDPAGLEYRLREILENKERIHQMRQQILKIAKPNAANDVLRIVLGY